MEIRNARSHQVRMDEVANKVIDQTFANETITLDCTPGGGKTGAATLLANKLLDANYIDCVLWVVPRLSLREQVLDAFATGFGARPGRSLEVVNSQDNLFSPSLPNMPRIVGCVTTYQSIAHKKCWTRFRDSIKGRRCLLIFDEVQFLNDEIDDDRKRDLLASKERGLTLLLITMIRSLLPLRSRVFVPSSAPQK